jgi:hypothetical protein
VAGLLADHSGITVSLPFMTSRRSRLEMSCCLVRFQPLSLSPLMADLFEGYGHSYASSRHALTPSRSSSYTTLLTEILQDAERRKFFYSPNARDPGGYDVSHVGVLSPPLALTLSASPSASSAHTSLLSPFDSAGVL